MTMAWGVVISLYLSDSPRNGKMFSEYERIVAVARVSRNKTGMKHPKFLPHQPKEAILDPETSLLLMTAASLGILNSGFANFLSTLIKGFGFDPLKISLLQTTGGAFEIIECILLGYLATVKNMVGPTIIPGCIPGIVGLAVIMTISIKHR